MKIYLLHLMLFAALLSFYGCKDTSEDELNFTYPMKVGYRWDYTKFTQITNFQPDSIAQDYERIDTTTVIVEITGAENLRDSIETFVFKSTEYEGQNQFSSKNYYKSTKDGLYIIAYDNNTGCLLIHPKKSNFSSIKFRGYNFSSIHELSKLIQQQLPIKKVISDSIIFEEPPVLSLKYPLTEGSKWTYRNDHYPFRMDKTIVEKKNINLNSVSFECYHIKWLYDIDHDGEWDDDIWIDDYISKEGLIKRKVSILGIVWTDETCLEIGISDYFEEFILTDVYL